ncbi:DNA methylase [Lachnospiraceae bacterium 42-17]|nr:DNA methylase [Dorea sp.]
MTQENRTYIAIDLKSFYASVECVERGLDPMTTNLVVADLSRTEKTICLAVSPSLKAYGISGRARLFEVVQRVKEVNAKRLSMAPGGKFDGSSYDELELKASPLKALDYIAAPPRMAHYIEYSTKIYEIYLKYIAPEDCHVYSIDEIMMDVTHYLNTYKMSARELTGKIIEDIRESTGITATAGIGTNLYLCKVAMDIVAKHIPPDKNGVRIASLNEKSYRRILWTHQPITDFWRVGKGYAKKLAEHGLFTMGDIARCSIGKPEDYYNEDLLYKLFGINAELLIDHAWGFEPCTMKDIKAYKPETNSICFGQVLPCPYTAKMARIVVREMAEMLGLDLFGRRLVTDQIVLTVGYDIENLADMKNRRQSKSTTECYKSGSRKSDSQVEIKMDRYGRKVPKHAHGTINLEKPTSSSRQIIKTTLELYDKIINKGFLVRRITIGANHVVEETSVLQEPAFEQLDLFTDYGVQKERKEREEAARKKERKLQQAMLDIKKKYGKNAILKGTNLVEGATATSRNRQIGGHKA